MGGRARFSGLTPASVLLAAQYMIVRCIHCIRILSRCLSLIVRIGDAVVAVITAKHCDSYVDKCL